jgi:hypothetical protein
MAVVTTAAAATAVSSGTAALMLIWWQSAALARLSQKRTIITSCTVNSICIMPYTSFLRLF